MIIWLASYPRSGNTFLRIVLNRFFGAGSYSQYNDERDIEANREFARLVGHQHYEGSWPEAYDRLSNDQARHFVKTHDHPADDAKAIYVVRDPRAAVSSYHAYLREYGTLGFSLADVVAGAVTFGRWDHHVRAWSPERRSNTLLLRYEELTDDLEKTVRAIGDFIEQEPRSMTGTDFSELRRVEPRFFRVGSNDPHIKALPDDARDSIAALYKDEIDRLGYSIEATPDMARVASYLADLAPQLWSSRQHQRTAEMKLDKAGSELADARQRAEQRRLELEKANQALAQLKPFQAQAQSAERVLHFAKEELKDVKGRLDARISEATALATQLAEVTVSAERAKDELANARAELEDRSKNVAGLEEEIRLLHGELANARAELEDRSKNVAGLEEEIRLLHGELEDARQRSSAFQSERQRIQEALDETERKLKKAYSDRSSAEAEADIARRRLSDAQQLLSVYSSELRHLQVATEPRLKSLLTLRPLRVVLAQRSRVKRGEIELGENGLFLPANLPEAPPRSMTPAAVTETATSEEKISGNLPPARPKTLSDEAKENSVYAGYEPSKPLGVALFTFDRTECVRSVLESLKLQDGLGECHVWIDGDQGRPAKRKLLDETEAVVSSYDVKAIHRNRGNYGFRKMIIVALRRMFEMYDRVLVLEDDCFPTRHCIRGFSAELDAIENRDDVFSVYGHPFLVPGERELFTRFQGWGWATTKDKFEPIWQELLDCYLMSEEEYLRFVDESLTDDVKKWIEVTPGRSPSDTLKKFFAWDETVTLLTGKKKLYHRPTTERLIYNFGLGAGSTHFGDFAHFRKPPFNMVSPEDIWSLY
ncbi:sulfotransferase domain-containing protein [Parvularcula lutaonensis]|uniref:Sulfotransferase domain-containing protein n=1 Tax=Parvularcula lutaonensis TaxID=491923 RepID=A0ABV7M6U9_9PROT|nr:sulfotransferase domain-containing protein [Parvularcula lutaonensis]GGY56521.1 hypothetical protein GCM10007148_27620 [Parvularcula lutaonensis]